MQDEPTAIEILASATAFLREEILPKLAGNDAFQLRVTANALDLVRRELMVPQSDKDGENAALAVLLGQEGSTEDLIRALAAGIADRTIDPARPEVEACLWAMTEAKLDVDQPGYAGLTRARALRGSDN
ncbi:DUF6285 domain-containing protein [Novosphingobium sp. HII-3]|uniref:DUF6285 domain-containing protein n=1 Tax=Novosphingobium sp. HII-3 TaxID=2075565 RepID=UPI000CDA556F|nr:DUF6285 domain-containing protein [Novosphingobium sp. HII-3]